VVPRNNKKRDSNCGLSCVRLAEEAAEELAGRMPGPQLHRLKTCFIQSLLLGNQDRSESCDCVCTSSTTATIYGSNGNRLLLWLLFPTYNKGLFDLKDFKST
jgi:hypothetical protein